MHAGSSSTGSIARIERDGYVRVREQARVQISGRKQRAPVHELLAMEKDRGLCRLPEPSAGDIFFDLESDPFVGRQGLEYLFAFTTVDGTYERRWALSAAEEKAAFEWFVDFVMRRWEEHPGMHIFHFSQKEPSTLKALMGRHATRESEIDRWLRGGLLVDLHSILKQSVRASVEQYSLKDLEVFHGFERALGLAEARTAMRRVEHALELGRVDDIGNDVREAIESYNADDCRSTASLREWLEEIREAECERGVDIPRQAPQEDAAPEAVSERQARVQALVTALQEGVPADEKERSPEQAARWLLSNLLDWHRREDKVAFWEKYRLREMTDEQLQDDRAAVSGLEFTHEIPPEGRKKAPLHYYSFPPQETKVREGSKIFRRDISIGTVEEIDPVNGIMAVRKVTKAISQHPPAVYTYKHVRKGKLAESLCRIAERAVANGFAGTEAAFDLLLRSSPHLSDGSALRLEGESPVEAAKRLVSSLNHTALAIQGPPGAGKTFTGARMILTAIGQGKRVGVTANSHKVIRNLLEDVQKAAIEAGRGYRFPAFTRSPIQTTNFPHGCEKKPAIQTR